MADSLSRGSLPRRTPPGMEDTDRRPRQHRFRPHRTRDNRPGQPNLSEKSDVCQLETRSEHGRGARREANGRH
eukprot:3469858-Rhodomonas_salina.1